MYYAGIDLGGTNIAVGILDDEYRIIGRAKIKTALPRPAEEIIKDMARAVTLAAEDAGISVEDIDNVGVGAPGAVDREAGVITYANNLGFRDVRITGPIGKLLNKERVYLENDANAAAAGEYYAGCGRGKHSLVQITLGTGVGGGVIIEGRMLTGFNGFGAELGHTVIVEGGEQCTCGRKGCFEAYASATALIRQTRRAMEADRGSKMWEIAGELEKVDGRTAFDAADAGDETARRVTERYLQYVACGVVDFVNIFQPEVLCIGGGICNQGEEILVPIRRAVAEDNYARDSACQTDVMISALGNDAGIIGAALLCKLV